MQQHAPQERDPYDYSRSSRRSSLGWLVTLLVFLIMVASLPSIVENVQYGMVRGRLRAQAEVATEQLNAMQQEARLIRLADVSKAFRLVAQRVEPSVVHIDTEQNVRPELDEWSALGGRYLRQGQGSGFVIEGNGADAYVLTNFHVIRNAERVQVQVSDGRTLDDVRVVGYDPATDLAVLRVAGGGLIAAEWGDSDLLEPGDWVLAIGNPYGLDRTLTAGIVSATQRRVASASPFQDFLQTDAAVNPGNSGGPLVNIQGEVVGINTAIVGEAYQGISFAIPSAVARTVYEQIRKNGQVVRGYLGVYPQPMSEELAARFGLEEARGVLVTDVLRGSPAAKAGIQPGDVIISWDGKPVNDAGEFVLMVAGTQVGREVEVAIVRDGQEESLKVTVEQRRDAIQLER
jgi:serine protease Do